MDGVIVVDKPAGWTSHDVVARVRRLANTKKVGHLGTLDPSATGVLPLVVGRATRLARFFSASRKTYDGVIRFGWATDTYDADGEPLGECKAVTLTRERAEELLAAFRGPIEQVPPPVSAKKIEGKPAYKLARENKPVNLKPVSVEIYLLEILSVEGPEVRVRVECSAGTYIRSIAHDVGQALGCGAHLKCLRRTNAGEFSLDQAHTLEELGELAKEDRLREAVIPAAQLLPDIPTEIVDEITAGRIRHGRDFRVSPFQVSRDAKYVKAVDPNGALVAVGEAKMPHLYHPVLVL